MVGWGFVEWVGLVLGWEWQGVGDGGGWWGRSEAGLEFGDGRCLWGCEVGWSDEGCGERRGEVFGECEVGRAG